MTTDFIPPLNGSGMDGRPVSLGLPSEPTLTLTLPSLHDGLPLDCRIYHPESLRLRPKAQTHRWAKHVALVAHPYPPLGGCQDDRVVSTVAGKLLRAGFLVATFNFRGAGGSPGRTSWTGKPEQADYMSVVGFLVYYSHFLDTAAHSDLLEAGVASPVFLSGGYSYGANIVAQLPSLKVILASFTAPALNTPAAEVRSRAKHTAEMQNIVLSHARAIHGNARNNEERSPRKSLGMRIGGDEDNRKSHEARRSFSIDRDEIRRGVADILHRPTRKGHRQHHRPLIPTHDVQESINEATPSEEYLPVIEDLLSHRASYLLVSPPQGIFKNLLNLSFTNPFPSRKLRRVSSQPLPGHVTETPDDMNHRVSSAGIGEVLESQRKLIQNPTLIVYGSQDLFVPPRKIRQWASSLQNTPGSMCRVAQVPEATHFWADEQTLLQLLDVIDAQSISQGLMPVSGASLG